MARVANNVVLSWSAYDTGYKLESRTNLNPAVSGNWVPFGGDPVRVGDEFQLVIGPASTPPNPIRFFRLVRQ
jgi:hypothetical protein